MVFTVSCTILRLVDLSNGNIVHVGSKERDATSVKQLILAMRRRYSIVALVPGILFAAFFLIRVSVGYGGRAA